MKYFLLLLAFVFASCTDNLKTELIPSKIDSLNKAAEIEQYIHAIDTNYIKFKLRPLTEYTNRDNYTKLDSIVRNMAKKYKVDKAFYKEDFDNNGYTDMLVVGHLDYCNENVTCQYMTFVLMNFGKDSIQFEPFMRGWGSQYPAIPEIVGHDGLPMIQLHEPGLKYDNSRRVQDSITLLNYKYGGFVEYNKKPAAHSIEKIQFATSGCYGTCPVFQLEINNDGRAMYLAEYHNYLNEDRHDEINGFFTGTIDKKQYAKIAALLNYIDFTSLKDEYAVHWTDDQTAGLVITYDGGKVKTIYDYGLVGTFGLRDLYGQFFNFRLSQKWHKAGQPAGFGISAMGFVLPPAPKNGQ